MPSLQRIWGLALHLRDSHWIDKHLYLDYGKIAAKSVEFFMRGGIRNLARADDRPRYFRLAEVNAMLPTLQRLLIRLRSLVEEARARHRELRIIKAVGHHEDGTLIMAPDYRVARERFDTTVQEADEIIDSIQRTGCMLKSVDLGLIDFPAVINGEVVLLCWRMGEPEVMYYHEWDTGYAGRRRLTPEDDDTPL